MRAGAGAAVGVVTELMDVHATLGTRVVARDVPGDAGGRGLRGLLEGHLSGDLGVSSEDGNCRGWRWSVTGRAILWIADKTQGSSFCSCRYRVDRPELTCFDHFDG